MALFMGFLNGLTYPTPSPKLPERVTISLLRNRLRVHLMPVAALTFACLAVSGPLYGSVDCQAVIAIGGIRWQ